MIKQTLMAGTAVIAFSQAAQAAGPMPDISLGGTPEDAFTMLGNEGSCVLSSDALNPDGLVFNDDQSYLSELARQVAETELGRIVAQSNAASDVVYCYWEPRDTDFAGVYLKKYNIAAVFEGDEESGHLKTMAEEMTHAHQFQSNPYFQNLDQLAAYDQYIVGMGLESQAKIWTTHILNELGEPAITNVPSDEEDTEYSIYGTINQCYQQTAGRIDVSCLEGSFLQF
jgi:hypothetical protein